MARGNPEREPGKGRLRYEQPRWHESVEPESNLGDGEVGTECEWRIVKYTGKKRKYKGQPVIEKTYYLVNEQDTKALSGWHVHAHMDGPRAAEKMLELLKEREAIKKKLVRRVNRKIRDYNKKTGQKLAKIKHALIEARIEDVKGYRLPVIRQRLLKFPDKERHEMIMKFFAEASEETGHGPIRIIPHASGGKTHIRVPFDIIFGLPEEIELPKKPLKAPHQRSPQ